jgi:hypothetical protein
MSVKEPEVNVVSHSLSLLSLITGLELHRKEIEKYSIILYGFNLSKMGGFSTNLVDTQFGRYSFGHL